MLRPRTRKENKNFLGKYEGKEKGGENYVARMLRRSAGEEAEALSLARTQTTRSSGSPSKKSDLSAARLRQDLIFFL